MSVSINGTGGITFADASTQSTGGYTGFRNRIINGAMMIDQRNAGASVTANDSVFAVDRFRFSMTQSSKGTGQRSTTAPTGFTNSMLFTSSSAYSVLAADQFAIVQVIEGFNVADLSWGSAGAQTVTLSFWVRSSLTGTFGGSLQNQAANRSYPFTYTISAANTWEQKSVTIAGDTSGTWNTDNNGGIRLFISLGMGSNSSGTAGAWSGSSFQSATGATSIVGTSGATFYITGVQLEKGSGATPFEFRPYGQELALCQRYYFKNIYQTANTRFANGLLASASDVDGLLMPLPVAMRAQPTIAYLNCAVWDGSASNSITAITANYSTSVSANFRATTSGMTAGRYCQLHSGSNTDAFVSASAEL